MTLINPGFKDQKLVSFGGRGANRREKRQGEEGRIRRGRGRRGRSQDQAKPSSKKVWNY